jgi:hypothetical protein
MKAIDRVLIEASRIKAQVGPTTAFTCRAGCKERDVSKTVVPARSSATLGSPTLLHVVEKTIPSSGLAADRLI